MWAVVEIRVLGAAMCAVPLCWYCQDSPGVQQGDKTQGQVQGLALVLEQE